MTAAAPGLPRAMRPARPCALAPCGPQAIKTGLGAQTGAGAEREAGPVLILDLHPGPLPDEGAALLAAGLRAIGRRVALLRPAGDARSLARGAAVRIGDLVTARGGGPAPELLILSAPLAARPLVARLAALAAARPLPVLVDASAGEGGAAAWDAVPDLFGIIGPGGGLEIRARVEKVGGMRFAGIPARAGGLLALCETAQIVLSGAEPHVPDYSDTPLAGPRVIPVRAVGRTGPRSLDALRCEMLELSRRHDSASFLFIDPVLNAEPDRLRKLGAAVPAWFRGAEWAGRVVVDAGAGGLGRAALRAAAAGGLRRLALHLPAAGGDDIRAAAADVLAQAAEAGIRMELTLPAVPAEGRAALRDFAAAQAPVLQRLRLSAGLCDRGLARLAARINAQPEGRAGRQFAGLL